MHPARQNPSTVAAEAACQGCGYDLRGLAIHGVCPECGRPVASSVRGNLLRFADPRWVARMSVGLTLVYTAAVCFLVAAVLLIVAFAVNEQLAGDAAATARAWMIEWVVIGACALAGAVSYGLGWWLATARDPAGGEHRAAESSVLRTTSLLSPPAVALWIWLGQVGGLSFAPGIPSPAFALASLAIVWVHLALLARLTDRLAARCAPVRRREGAGGIPRGGKRPVLLGLAPGIVAVLLGYLLVQELRGVAPRLGRPGAVFNFGWLLMIGVWLAVTAGAAPLVRGVRAERAMLRDITGPEEACVSGRPARTPR